MSEPKKVFYQGGSELTQEDREHLKNWANLKEQERTDLLLKLDGMEAPVVNFMDAKFDPFEDRVLVYPDPAATKTDGGLFIPEDVTKKEKPLKGTVVKVGPGKAGVKYHTGGMNKHDDGLRQELPLNAGDRIIFGKYAGTDFEINGIKYLIMRFADIFGREKTE